MDHLRGLRLECVMPKQKPDPQFDWFDACPLCQCKDLRTWEVSNVGYSIQPIRVRCHACGLVFSNPQASEDRLENHYQNIYFSDPEIKGDYFSAGSQAWLKSMADQDLDILDRALPARGSLIDVGAAAGYFLLQARSRGWKVEGVELSSKAAAHARRQGLRMHVARLEDLKLGRRFDALHCAHTIEHVKDPIDFCRRLGALMKPGGRMLLEVPNRRALWPQVWHYSARLRGQVPPLVHAKEHTFDFSPATFRRTLEAAGLRVIDLRCYEYPAGPLRLWRKEGENPLKALLRAAFVALARLTRAEHWYGSHLQVLAEAPRT